MCFWQRISIYLVKPVCMKTIENLIIRLTSVFSASQNKSELMPQLIPVRVITNRIPGKKDH
jgi:hypothetical protein